MSGDTVLGDQCGNRCRRIFIEQAVVPNTETYRNVKVCSLSFQFLRLKNWIAHGRAHISTAFRNAYRDFQLRSGLTADAYWFESSGTENICENGCFIEEANAGRGQRR